MSGKKAAGRESTEKQLGNLDWLGVASVDFTADQPEFGFKALLRYS